MEVVGSLKEDKDLSLRIETLSNMVRKTQLRSRDMFLGNHSHIHTEFERNQRYKLSLKIAAEYAVAKDMAPPPPPAAAKGAPAVPGAPSAVGGPAAAAGAAAAQSGSAVERILGSLPSSSTPSNAIVAFKPPAQNSHALASVMKKKMVLPDWHAPWKLMRVVSGHLGWVRCLAFDPSNEWFATGSVDRTIKIWDLASGTLKLTLTGHISAVRGLAVSDRHPYMFSVGEDKMVKCWDLECNKVIRSYHGHLSGVYCCAIHPTIDLLITGGRDSTARVWDMRTKVGIMTLASHQNTVCSLLTQQTEPQIITGSHDSTVKLWDLAAGKCHTTLTHHKKSIRALCQHPSEYCFASGSADNLKVWKCPDGNFLRNVSAHKSIVNALAVNQDGVLVSGGDNGTLYMHDWKTGYTFQRMTSVPQPGSMDNENSIFAMEFDRTGTRLITCEGDKTIKFWKEDETATPETHPIDFVPSKQSKRY
eukprot:gnl/Hemi2/2033_TR727_c0_g1_i1.p1 gnl/Hemi2/2033_TR727_c0_g1~~gnl/Hemi2/2033_TR727_c0_g1_i1.p1  ORF type:complete len:475 (+),score=130.89 gnl/Hemi2/2033_TR727_c0_g1_i1:91-1515(+)